MSEADRISLLEQLTRLEEIGDDDKAFVREFSVGIKDLEQFELAIEGLELGFDAKEILSELKSAISSTNRKDAERSKLFSTLSREITLAAKMGGPEPNENPRLNLAVKEARSNSMPKEAIDRAIETSQGGEAEGYEEVSYEGYGPGGVAVIVEAMTENRNRTAGNVRSYFSKNGGNIAETGAVSFMFERKGEIFYPATAGDEDTIMMAAIEAGAEDVESSEEGHFIYTADNELNDVSTSLEAFLGEAKSVKLIWKPITTTELDLDGAEQLMQLIKALEEDDDVRSVTANIEVNDDIVKHFVSHKNFVS